MISFALTAAALTKAAATTIGTIITIAAPVAGAAVTYASNKKREKRERNGK